MPKNADCPVCAAQPGQWCRYVGGTDAERPMSLFHDSRHKAAEAMRRGVQ